MLTIAEIAEACAGRLDRPKRQPRPSGFSIDSRTLQPGEFFIALPGQRTDGHRFLADAFARGACGALVRAEALDELPSGFGQNLIAVSDTGRAFQQVAHAYRAKFKIPLVAITGSAGKTTTKELLTHILRIAGYQVHCSPGNYNSEIGLPLSLLNMPTQTEVGVFELALQRPGEIAQLAQILKPTLGLITTIGDAHLGFFRDRQSLAAAKWELIDALPPDGLAVLNFDAPFLAEQAARAPCRVLGYGIDNPDASVHANSIDDSSLGGLRFTLYGHGMPCPNNQGRMVALETKLLGRPNVYNVMAAATAAEALGVDAPTLKSAIVGFRPVEHRLQLRRSERFGWLLDDSYNASPQATREALQTLARLSVPDHQKIFIFGGMLELGKHSKAAHGQIAAEIAQLSVIDRFFGLGKLAAETGQTLQREYGWDSGRVTLVESQDELIRAISSKLATHENLILIKGSRASELDRLVEALM